MKHVLGFLVGFVVVSALTSKSRLAAGKAAIANLDTMDKKKS